MILSSNVKYLISTLSMRYCKYAARDALRLIASKAFQPYPSKISDLSLTYIYRLPFYPVQSLLPGTPHHSQTPVFEGY